MQDKPNHNPFRSAVKPILLAMLLGVAILLGTRLSKPSSESFFFPSKNQQATGLSKLNQLLNFIQESYVDTVNRNSLLENSFNGMLQSLDPHSYYIPPAEYAEATESLEGNFEGIGVEFRIVNDTVTVINTIGGGPSERIGVLAGDRIIEVDDSSIAGVNMTNEKVIKLLKGPRGTSVKVTVLRKQKNETLQFSIKRDRIPIYSIDAAYMATPEIGYIKINKFAKNTYFEFVESADKLRNKGMKKLIIDLRNNGGGIMQSAIQIADEFIDNRKLIVYTRGRKRAKENYYATSKGEYHQLELAVLVNENSASASEILAGAIQDNDRGIIIGRRTFGKGLVQEQIDFPDGSAVRLTVARYYTPSGRSIQKPYQEGVEIYHQEMQERALKGELLSADSIRFPDSLKFYTPKGNTVYGGGGIMPDFFIPIDTIGYTNYLSAIYHNGIFQDFAFAYVDKERAKLAMYKNLQDFKKLFKVNEALLQHFFNFAKENGIMPSEKESKISRQIIQNRIKAQIARLLWKDEGFYSILNEEDKMIRETIEMLEK